MQGSDINPKGKVTLLGMLTNTQAMPPNKNSTVAVIRYTLVFLEESNLLKYDSNIPGNTIEVIGNHAHF